MIICIIGSDADIPDDGARIESTSTSKWDSTRHQNFGAKENFRCYALDIRFNSINSGKYSVNTE